ncbi:MAG: response regulator [Deltaproteobacteria bacterium]
MKGCIMLVDEVGIVKIEMNAILKEYGIEVAHVKDGMEAINYLHANRENVKLILWSYVSQDYSDFETIKNIKSKEQYQAIPIAIISKFTDRKYIVKAIESGVSEFIAKPYDYETVVKKIDKLLGNIILGNTGREQEDVLMFTFSDMLTREIKAAGRGNHSLTIILATVVDEVGKMKNTNEFYDVINDMVKVTRTKLRDTDTVFYYGSNNMIVLLPFCNKEGSLVVEQKIKNIFNSHTTIKSKVKGVALIASSVTFPDDGKMKEKLLEKLTKDLINITAL